MALAPRKWLHPWIDAMSKVRRYMRLPHDWEKLEDEELERLCDRADRVKELLPDLPPLDGRLNASRRRSFEDEEYEAEERPERKGRPGGVDRETILEQRDERAD